MKLFIFKIKTILRNLKSAFRLGWSGEDIIETYSRLLKCNGELHMENIRLTKPIHTDCLVNQHEFEELGVEVDTEIDSMMGLIDWCLLQKKSVLIKSKKGNKFKKHSSSYAKNLRISTVYKMISNHRLSRSQ